MADELRDTTLKFGVIGCGYIAQTVHLPLLARMVGVQVVALADVDDSRLARARSWYPAAREFHDHRELLGCDEIDGVIICVPTALHAEVAKAAIDAGKQIYLETPLANTIAAAHEVRQAWCQSGVVGMMGLNLRFNPLYREMRDVLRRGELGAIVGARSVFTTFPRWRLGWTASQGDAGGVLLEKASHEIDLTRFLFDAEIDRVFAERVGNPDAYTVSMHLRLTNGISVQGLYSLGTIEEGRYEVYGEDGKLSIDRYRSWKLRRQGLPARGLITRIGALLGELTALPYGLERLRSPENEPSYQTALKTFVDAVRHDLPVEPDVEDGLRVVATISATEASIRTGQPVPVAPRE